MMKKNKETNYQMAWETQDNDFICFCKDTPITVSTVLHNHDGYEIYLFLSGDIRLNFEHDSWIMERGDMVLIPPYVFHYAVPIGDSTYSRVVINIKESYIQKRGALYAHFTDCFYQTESSHLNVLHLNETQIARYCDYAKSLDQTLLEPASAFGHEFLAESLLTTILVFIGRISDTSQCQKSRHTAPPAITAIFQYIDEHLTENLLLAEIAEQVHLNPVYVTRIFKAYTGMPVQQYIIEKRLSQAKKLLRDGKSPIDVCFMCGFNNYSNFSRTFSKHLKLSPKQYQISSRASFYTQNSAEQR